MMRPFISRPLSKLVLRMKCFRTSSVSYRKAGRGMSLIQSSVAIETSSLTLERFEGAINPYFN
jgi:hypothetical protein